MGGRGGTELLTALCRKTGKEAGHSPAELAGRGRAQCMAVARGSRGCISQRPLHRPTSLPCALEGLLGTNCSISIPRARTDPVAERTFSKKHMPLPSWNLYHFEK